MSVVCVAVVPKAKAKLDACPYLTNVGAQWATMQNWAVVARLWTISICAPILKDCMVCFSSLANSLDELRKLPHIQTTRIY